MKIFEPALAEMANEKLDTYGPVSFKEYLEKHELDKSKNTAQCISIDSVKSLAKELRDAGVMVFRLGARPEANTTHFALAKCSKGWDDFFLDDRKLISAAAPKVFAPSTSPRRLFAFQLLPKLTENSLVHLAVASGLLQDALGIDEDHEQVVPATGQSTFTFQILPKSHMPEPWDHIKGQVEVDALFSGRREGEECLFLVEAKSGDPNGTLAKHKLCYPLAALRKEVPNHIKIVPVYLKTWPEREGQHFLVTECTHGNNDPVVISDLESSEVWHMVIHGFGG